MIATARLRLLVELVLIAFLVVQAGRLAWVFLEPASSVISGVAAPAPAPDLAVLKRYNPFGGSPPAVDAAETSAAPALILYGVRTGPGATAIIGAPGGPQKVYRVGEQISPGVALRSVGADHVMVGQGSSSMRLALARAASAATAPPGSYTSPPRAP